MLPKAPVSARLTRRSSILSRPPGRRSELRLRNATVVLVLGTGLVAAFICLLLHRIVHHDKFRRYHEVGYAVFLQLGVIFAVLLAFVFNSVWSDYNAAAQAIDSECASLHGIAILSDRLPSPARDAVLDDLHAYLRTVLDREWPDMRLRNDSQAAADRFR